MGKTVQELMIAKVVKLREQDPIYEAVAKIAEDRETMIACVVDQEDRLKGIITPREVLKAVAVCEYETVSYPFFGPEILHLLSSKYAKDIMCAPISVLAQDEADKAIEIMLAQGFYEVPVVDERARVIGAITYFDIITSSINCLKGLS